MSGQSEDAPPETAREAGLGRQPAGNAAQQNTAPRRGIQRGEDALDNTLAETDVASLSPAGVQLASSLLRRIAEIERASGPDVAEAVVERLIDVFEGRRKLLS